MRKKLYMFRHDKQLSQAEMADKIGCHRGTYASIEKGEREGRKTFWNSLQNAFGLSDAETEELKKIDKAE